MRQDEVDAYAILNSAPVRKFLAQQWMEQQAERGRVFDAIDKHFLTVRLWPRP